MYPQPLRLGKKTVAWSAQDIETAINLLNKKKTPVVGADESVRRQ
jgi:predicted DNA-binding transcriptional regulator AlpA